MHRVLVVAFGLVLIAALSACGTSAGATISPTSQPAPSASTAAPETSQPAAGGGGLMVTSTAFTEGGNIPQKYSCQGEKVSPELKWSGAPAATKSFALIVEDPDAPSGTFIHWVAFDIPASQTEIIEGANQAGKGGKNSAGQNTFTPPCPPSGSHRYIFNIYALDVASLNLNPGATRDQVTNAMQGHILAQGKLMGRYAKQ